MIVSLRRENEPGDVVDGVLGSYLPPSDGGIERNLKKLSEEHVKLGYLSTRKIATE